MKAWLRGLSTSVGELGAGLSIGEREARALIEGACRRHGVDCPRCGHGKPYQLKDGRLRCRECRLSFGLTAGRWVARCRIPARSWVVLMRGFSFVPHYRDLVRLSGLSLRTTFLAVGALRQSLVAADEAWSGFDAGAMKAFSLTRGERTLQVRPADPESLALRAEDIVHRNGFLYVQGRGDCHAVVLHGSAAPGELQGPPLDRRGAADPILAFLRQRATSHRRVEPEHFPLYLKEWECRFNMEPEAFFRHLLDCATRRVPRAERRDA